LAGAIKAVKIMEKEALSLRGGIYSALFSALYVAGTYIRIPLGPVPIVLTNMFIFLGGLILPWPWAAASAGLYLLLGVVGLPVFSGGGGPAYFAGPTGGYLFGYPAAAACIGLVSKRGGGKRVFPIVSLAAGILLIYACGVPWLKMVLKISWAKAFAAGMLPFIPGDAVKAAAAYGIFLLYKRVLPHATFTR